MTASTLIALSAASVPFVVASGHLPALPTLDLTPATGRCMVVAGLAMYLLAVQLLPVGVEAAQRVQDEVDDGPTVDLD